VTELKASAFALFSELLEGDDALLEAQLSKKVDKNTPLYQETLKLIHGHRKAVQGTSITPILAGAISDLDQCAKWEDMAGKQIERYQIIRELGRGGMSVVYLAERNDETIKQSVALKFILPKVLSLIGHEYAFKEAQYLADISHPNIAKIIDVGTYQSCPFIVMEYVNGHHLSAYITINQLSLKEKVSMILKVCSGVGLLHQKLIVHADIKPSNILVDDLGEPKLIDFGIARYIDANQSQNFKAASGYFSSPEQLAGESLSSLSDIFSLGKLLERTVVNDELPADLKMIIDKATRKKPEQRFRSVEQFESCLLAWLNNDPIALRSNESMYRLGKFFQRKPFAGVSVVALLVLVCYFIYSYVQINKQYQSFYQLAGYFEDTLSIGENELFSGRQVTVQQLAIQSIDTLLQDNVLDIEQKRYLLKVHLGSLSYLGEHAQLLSRLNKMKGIFNSPEFTEVTYWHVAALANQKRFSDAVILFNSRALSQDSNWFTKSAAVILNAFVDSNQLIKAHEFLNSKVWQSAEVDEIITNDMMIAKIKYHLASLDLETAEKSLSWLKSVPNLSLFESIQVDNLRADLSMHRNHFVMADGLYQKSLNALKERFGEYHPLYVKQLKKISILKQRQGDDAAAHDLLKDAPYRLFNFYNRENDAVAQAWVDLAVSNSKSIEYEQRLNYFSKAMSIYERIVAGDSSSQATQQIKLLEQLIKALHLEHHQEATINTAKASVADLQVGSIPPYGHNVVIEYYSDHVFYPKDKTQYTMGKIDYIRWDNSEILGEKVSLFVVRASASIDELANRGLLDLSIFNNLSFERFAHNIDNVGQYMFNPEDMSANGKGLKVFVVSDTGYWGFSKGSSEVLTGEITDNGLISQFDVGGYADAIIFPAQKETVYWQENTTFKWNKTLLLGKKATLYVLHDEPTAIGGGVQANIEIVKSRRWYPFAVNIPNTGSFELDPSIMDARGNKYKFMVVTERGYWAVSESTFAIWQRPNQ
jgi:eukaryotic-like serine/threonine-protein kinase